MHILEKKKGLKSVTYISTFSSVQFSHSVESNSLWPHELQHARSPCISPTPGVYSNSWQSSGWCHVAISSSVIRFSSCPQSLPASGSFPMSQLFTWGGQSTGVLAKTKVYDRGWDGWMASQTRWTLVWVNSGSWWWAGRPGVLRFMGSQRVGLDWANELNWRIISVVNWAMYL